MRRGESPFSPAQPARSWQEVVDEFNRRNPDRPITSAKAARQYHTKAIRQLRAALAPQQRRGDL